MRIIVWTKGRCKISFLQVNSPKRLEKTRWKNRIDSAPSRCSEICLEEEITLLHRCRVSQITFSDQKFECSIKKLECLNQKSVCSNQHFQFLNRASSVPVPEEYSAFWKPPAGKTDFSKESVWQKNSTWKVESFCPRVSVYPRASV